MIYDPIHIIKNIRNNWITEKNKTIQRTHPDTNELMTAKWSDLIELYNHEQKTTNGLYLSKLTKAAIDPSNIDKQKAALALCVFCDATVAALKNSSIFTESSMKTAEAIALVVKLFKKFNTKTRSKKGALTTLTELP